MEFEFELDNGNKITVVCVWDSGDWSVGLGAGWEVVKTVPEVFLTEKEDSRMDDELYKRSFEGPDLDDMEWDE